MSDGELSGFEEDGNFDEEGLSEIYSDISIESELDINVIEEYAVIIIGLRMSLLMCRHEFNWNRSGNQWEWHILSITRKKNVSVIIKILK